MSENPYLTSIIVVTHNNLNNTRQCLQSIYMYTELETFELIIVDVASNDGTRDYIQSFSNEHQNCKRILLAETTGNSAAYNKGAELAKGAYLVFLDGNTFLTPNWLPGLLKHLDQNGVGMVGPVTNATDVETHISVDYVDMDDMLVFAADYIDAHVKKIFKVQKLPFLCVVIRFDVFLQIGGLDEQFTVSMYDDDYGIRIREAGLIQGCAQDVFVHCWMSPDLSWEEEKEYWESFNDDRKKLEMKWGIQWKPSRYRDEFLEEQIRQLWNDKHDLKMQVFALRTEVSSIQDGFAWKILDNIQQNIESKASWILSFLDGVNRLLNPLITLMGKILKSLIARWKEQKRLWRLWRLRHQMQRELENILENSPGIREIVVFVPTINWNSALFQRPHQLALALSKKNCLVFFCEPAKSKDFVGRIVPIHENLYIVGPGPLDIFKSLPSPIVFTLPYNRADLKFFMNPRVVYEYIDELGVFYGSPKIIKLNHDALVRDADVVLATAENLFDEIHHLRPDALMIPNAADITFIRQRIKETNCPPNDLKPYVKNDRPIAGYYGALAKWLDYRLLKSVAGLLPNWYFILIGLDYDGSVNRSRVLEYPNILWLGSKPYEKIPSYLKYFDVATIPFRLNEITHATSPLKLFEYMAAGKPIVTTAMNECQKYPPVLIAKDAGDFALKLENSLSMRSDQSYQNSLFEWAEKNTWEQRAAQILNAVTAHSKNADD